MRDARTASRAKGCEERVSTMIDLNADLGEECGDDFAMLEIVSSASIAAGGHAGGGKVLRDTVARAAARNIRIGAHPSYPDRTNFGRVSPIADTAPQLFLESLVEQILRVANAAHHNDTAVSYVKPHGALYNDAMINNDAALLVGRATCRANEHSALRSMPPLSIMGQPGSRMETVSRDLGVAFIPEGFADRAYNPNGTLVSRSLPGAVLDDATVIAAHVTQMVRDGTVTAIDGSTISVPVLSICVHGDTPGAVALAHTVRAVLAVAPA